MKYDGFNREFGTASFRLTDYIGDGTGRKNTVTVFCKCSPNCGQEITVYESELLTFAGDLLQINAARLQCRS